MTNNACLIILITHSQAHACKIASNYDNIEFYLVYYSSTNNEVHNDKCDLW